MVHSWVVLVHGLLATIWLTIVLVGFAVWEIYDRTPGDNPSLVTNQPAARGHLELVMFVHPHCPCARASLSELKMILTIAKPELKVRVLFVRPVGADPGWVQGSLWDEALELPGVEVACDEDGAEAKQAQAIISGHVVLRDATGAVLFHGGITPGRNRVGSNPGRQSVMAWLRGERGATSTAPVFGCPLLCNRSCCAEENLTCPK
jgi:hypothetical protein